MILEYKQCVIYGIITYNVFIGKYYKGMIACSNLKLIKRGLL